MPRIAAFVTPHGYGHAARLSAILAELGRSVPGLEIQIWTTVPRFFFAEALASSFDWIEAPVDVGVVQRSAVEEDPRATLAALEAWELRTAAAAPEWLERLASFGPDVVLCDIAPLGLELAARAGRPGILVESFTWHWIYEPYRLEVARLGRFAERFAAATASARLRIRAEPLCAADPAVPREVRIPPVARRSTAAATQVRERLGLGAAERLVVVTLGGIPCRLEGAASWELDEGVVIAAVGAAERIRREGRTLLLPHRLPWAHRDLVGAADLVVGKLGYSTLAEAWASGAAYLYVPRPGFRESAVLERWVAARLPAAAIPADALRSGAWTAAARRLLSLPRPAPAEASGAAAAAAAIAPWLGAGVAEPASEPISR